MQEPNRRKPRQARSLKTYDALLDAAGKLLGEIGIENVSTNLICEPARGTPPARGQLGIRAAGALLGGCSNGHPSPAGKATAA